jgi:hypothetical protein
VGAPRAPPDRFTPGGSVAAPKNKKSDFLHSETQKTAITPLTSTNQPRNPRRFLSIFVRKTALFGPKSPPPRIIDVMGHPEKIGALKETAARPRDSNHI